MKVTDAEFVKGFIRMCDDGYQLGFHERNGGNASYRMKEEEKEEIAEQLSYDREFVPIGTSVPNLAGEYFLVTGSGKYFRNMILAPEENMAVIEIDSTGDNYRIVWGLSKGGVPTSELPSHLMNHEVKKEVSNGAHRVIYHSHTPNVIALTYVLPLKGEVFTRELWEMMTECPVIFSDGIGVLPWMVPGGRDIAVASSKLMRAHNALIWAHHGIFCSGTDFDEAFGLMHTIEKAAGILLKVLAVRPDKLQTIQPDDFRELAQAFHVELDEKYLYEK